MINLTRNTAGHIEDISVSRNEIHLFKSNPVKISVIVPVYNAENLLDETLLSIRNQTLKDIEIICVDDASFDSSASVLRRHLQEDPRIQIISNTENSGTGVSLNLGLELASGIYVQYVGNDDTLTLRALEKLFALCEGSNVDFCQYAIEVVNDDPSNPFLRKRAQAMERYHALAENYPILSGVDILTLSTQRGEYRMSNGPQIVKRSLLDSNGIRNLENLHHEDMYYTYRVLLVASRATLITDPLYHYRVRINSLEAARSDRTQTAHEFSSILISASEMITATPDDLFNSPDFIPVIQKRINTHLAAAAKQYRNLPPKERDKVTQPRNKTAASLLYTIETLTNELDDAEKKKSRIQNSHSYKLGHALLAVPYRVTKFLNKRKAQGITADQASPR